MLNFWTITLILFSIFANAAEEPLDLENEQSPVQKTSLQLSQIKIMGRVDFTSEYYPQAPPTNDGFKTYHFFLFAKVEASPRVSFMGEVLQQSFFDINYKPYELVNFHFGKILVPFGDTSSYHHFYGGIQAYGAKGVMFPNIWAEEGVDSEWHLGPTLVDLYVVSGISSQTTDTDPVFNTPSNNQHQAGGLRLTEAAIDKIKLIASGYYENWLPNKTLIVIGGDVSTDYGLFGQSVLKHLRINTGRAIGYIQGGTTGDYRKAGDYFGLSTNALSFAELRARYGTYIDNSSVQTQNDTHSINLGALIPIDVLKLLVEYQWNFEAVNEIPNDVARMMLSLDF